MAIISGDRSRAAGRLLDAALALALEEGPQALSARRLAVCAGASASAVNYYFEGRDGLLAQVQAAAAARSESLRMSVALDEQMIPGWSGPGERIAALLQRRLAAGGRLIALMGAFAAEATTRSPELAIRARSEACTEAAHWRKVALLHDSGNTDLWAAMALGLLKVLAFEDAAEVHAAWTLAPCRRLADRLAGLSPSHSAGLEDGDPALAPAPSGTIARILDATLVEIARAGPGRVTQRGIAAAAGLSLASITYFFRTRDALMLAAFAELHRRVAERSLDTGPSGAGSAQLREIGRIEDDVALIDALMCEAAWAPHLRPVARAMRRSRGAMSLQVLRGAGFAADGLDAFVLATLMNGTLALLAANNERSEARIKARVEALMVRMFPGVS